MEIRLIFVCILFFVNSCANNKMPHVKYLIEEEADFSWQWIDSSKYVCIAEIRDSQEVLRYDVADKKGQNCSSIEFGFFSSAWTKKELNMAIDLIESFRDRRVLKRIIHDKSGDHSCILRNIGSPIYKLSFWDDSVMGVFSSKKCPSTKIIMTRSRGHIIFEISRYFEPYDEVE